MSESPPEQLTDETELLFRQVNPVFVRDGRVGSQAFRPTPKDQRMLSVARASRTTAEAAFQHHTGCLKLSSAGTWAVTVGECSQLGLPARPDEVTEQPCPDPAHAVVPPYLYKTETISVSRTGCVRPSSPATVGRPASTCRTWWTTSWSARTRS